MPGWKPQNCSRLGPSGNHTVHAAFEHGLLLLGCGRNTVRITPPLCVARGEVEEGLEIFEQAVTEAEKAAGLL